MLASPHPTSCFGFLATFLTATDRFLTPYINKAATATTAAPAKLPPSLAPSPWLKVVVGAGGAIVEGAAPETVVKPPVADGAGATLPGVVYRGAVRVVPGRIGLA